MCTTGAFYECQEEWENHWAKQKLKKKKKKKEIICAYSGLPNMRFYDKGVE